MKLKQKQRLAIDAAASIAATKQATQHVKTTFSAFLLRHGYRYKSTIFESKAQNVHMAVDIYKAANVVVYEYNGRSNTLGTARYLWRFLKHKNFLRCMETFVGENGRDNIYITEFCTNSTVLEYVNTDTYRKMSPEERERLIRKWTLQCIQALLYVKSMGLITYNLGWDEVLLDHNVDIKLATISTLTYMRPQERKPWGGFLGKCPEATRRWSLVDREKMAYAEIFIVGIALLKLFNIFLDADADNNWSELAPKIASAQGISEDGKDFLTRAVETKWRNRLLYHEALQHPWLKLAAEEIAPKTALAKRLRLKMNAGQTQKDDDQAITEVKSRLVNKLLAKARAMSADNAVPSTSSQHPTPSPDNSSQDPNSEGTQAVLTNESKAATTVTTLAEPSKEPSSALVNNEAQKSTKDDKTKADDSSSETTKSLEIPSEHSLKTSVQKGTLESIPFPRKSVSLEDIRTRNDSEARYTITMEFDTNISTNNSTENSKTATSSANDSLSHQNVSNSEKEISSALPTPPSGRRWTRQSPGATSASRQWPRHRRK